ncbi:MAG: endonuclease MutS2 [Candidatus Latescibacterota bacterium]
MNQNLSYSHHALRVLEFERLREIVASLADSAEGKAAVSGLHPYRDSDRARKLLAEVDEVMNAVRFDDPTPGLTFHNIRELFPLLKVEGYRLEIEAIAAIAENLAIAREIRDYFEKRRDKYPLVGAIAGLITPHEEIERRVRRTILPDLTIADDATPELRSIRRQLERSKAELRSIVDRTLSSLSDDVVSERVVTIRDGRYVIPVRDSMKSRVAGAVHDRSQTGRTLFIEPLASIEGNNRVRELELAEQEEIDRILRELTALIGAAADSVVLNQGTLARLDVIFARARYGVRSEGVVPRINDAPAFIIKQGRHPLLDWKFRKRADGSRVTPMDLSMGDGAVTVVVTGPNAGGKTVALKTVGLLTVMALCGIPVPAGEGTELFAPTGIFADIGDEQSIEDDLSTFSSHMKQIVTILREAEYGSLVLMDELGGGTNPADGEAIALAVLRKLTAVRALTLATTHHGGLKVFAHETEGVLNASMEFDSENLRPTFVLRMGIPGSSYAFEIAARMGMPAPVLADAEALAGGERKSLENLILEMEQRVRDADRERRAAENDRIRMEAEKRKYEKKLEEFSQKRQEMLGAAVAESQRIMETANRSIETAIRAIKEQNASKESITEARATVTRAAEEIREIAREIPVKGRNDEKKPLGALREGMRVRVDRLGSDAIVEQVLDGGKKARVLIGKSKASLVVNAAELSAAEAPGRAEQTVRVSTPTAEVESTEIDLRGLNFEDARDELELFLDRMHRSGMDIVHIIHGKGTGALRTKLSAWLEHHPFVESRRLGEWNEGGAGVTVVVLRK